MFRLSVSMILFALCFSCNKKEAEVENGNTVSSPWTWRTPQSRPLNLKADVSTIAGFPGDIGSLDGVGLYATLSTPSGITTDGNYLYITDYGDSTIKKVNIRTQEVTTIAGQVGVNAHADGIGTDATFTSLWMITTDGSSLFITDGSAIRKMDIATQEVTTLAGSPSLTGTLDGIKGAARFNMPTTGIATDGINLFVADGGNNTIRKILISTGEVSTFAGSGVVGSANGIGTAAQFNYPFGLSTDGSYLYVADSSNTIRKVSLSTGMVTTLAGDPALAAGQADGRGRFARFNDPFGITDDGTNLYVTEFSGCTLRKIVKATGEVTTLAGTYNSCSTLDGNGAAALSNWPYSITTDGKSLYLVEDTVVRKVE